MKWFSKRLVALSCVVVPAISMLVMLLGKPRPCAIVDGFAGHSSDEFGGNPTLCWGDSDSDASSIASADMSVVWKCLRADDATRLKELLSKGLNPNALLLSDYWNPRRGRRRLYTDPILTAALKCNANRCAEALIDHGADPLFAGVDGFLPVQYALENGYAEVVAKIVSLSPKLSEVRTPGDLSSLIHRIRPSDAYFFPSVDVRHYVEVPCDESDYLHAHGSSCPCWNPILPEQYPACILHFTTNGIPYHYKYHWKESPTMSVWGDYGYDPLTHRTITSVLGIPADNFFGILGIDR